MVRHLEVILVGIAGIRIVCVFTDSLGGIPLGHPNRPDEVAELVAFRAFNPTALIIGNEYITAFGNIPFERPRRDLKTYETSKAR